MTAKEQRITELTERIDNVRRWLRQDRELAERIEATRPHLEATLDCFEMQRTVLAVETVGKK